MQLEMEYSDFLKTRTNQLAIKILNIDMYMPCLMIYVLLCGIFETRIIGNNSAAEVKKSEGFEEWGNVENPDA